MASNKTEIEIDGKNTGAIVAINGVKQELTGLGNTIGGPFATAMKSLTGFMSFAAIGTGIGVLANFTKQAIDTADQISKMSQKVGVSVESLSTLRYAAEISDLSMETFGTTLKKLSQNLFDVAHGQGKDVAIAFSELGISATDSNGKLRATEEVLLQVADKFSAMTDGTEKTALAVKLFGRSGMELIPFLNQGKVGLQNLTDEAEKLGLKLDTETAQAAEKFNDSLKTLKESINGLAYKSLPTILDFFTGVIDGFNQMNEAAEKSTNWLDWYFTMYSDAVIRGNKDAAKKQAEAFKEAIEIARTKAMDQIKGFGLEDVRNLVRQTESILAGIKAQNPYPEQQNDIDQINAKLNVYNNYLNDSNQKAKNQLSTVRQLVDEYAKLVQTKARGNPEPVATKAGATISQISDYTPGFDMLKVEENPFDPLANYAINFFDIYDERAQQMRQQTSEMFGNMSSAASAFYQMSGQKSKEWFAIQKGFNIAQAVMNTYEGATKALAQGGFFGIAMAATVIAAGLAQVAMIAAQQPNASGGGGARSVSSGGSALSHPSNLSNATGNYNPGQNVNYTIIVQGNIVDQNRFARELVPAINRAVSDGVS